MQENRFCDRCMQKTLQEIVENDEIIYTYKRKRFTNVPFVVVHHIKEA